MSNELEPFALAEDGKRQFAAKQYALAAESFRQAAEGYTLGRNGLLAAEMKNNQSVALLQAGRPAEAYEVAAGTERVFAGAGDISKQAMALGNQAAALDALKKYEEALEAYEESAALFAQAGEDEMRSIVLKSAASIKLRQGKLTDTAFEMLNSLGAVKKPTLVQRFLKFLLRLKP